MTGLMYKPDQACAFDQTYQNVKKQKQPWGLCQESKTEDILSVGSSKVPAHTIRTFFGIYIRRESERIRVGVFVVQVQAGS